MTFLTGILKGWVRLHGVLPLGWHRAWGRVAGAFLDRVVRYRREIVAANLARCFPEKDYPELVRVRKRFYRHLGRVFTEALWQGGNRGEKGRQRLLRSGMLTFTNPEEFNRMYAASPSGVVVLMNHTGNWELIGGVLGSVIPPGHAPLAFGPENMAITYRRLHSAAWDAVMEDTRLAPLQGTAFHGYLETKEILRFAFSHRDSPYVYAFITDQYPYGSARRREPVRLMGQDTVTMTGAAALALKMGMATAYLRFAEREDGKGYFLTAVPVSAAGEEVTALEVMERYYRLLEEDLRAQPWNYLWTHKRWKQTFKQ